METTYALNENETLQEIKRPPRIGFIKTFAGATPPEGTLLCDGSAVSRDTYSELFAAIGTTWGAGDGANTFNLPDLRDVWILCAGTEHEAGENVAEGLPDIQGVVGSMDVKLDNGTFSHAVNYEPLGAFYMETRPQGTPGTGSVQHATGASNSTYSVLQIYASRSNSIYGAQPHVTPASVAILPCIVFE